MNISDSSNNNLFFDKPTPRITALMSFYNEMHYLPGWYENLRDHTNAIVVLDDGSTDGSREYVASQSETTQYLLTDPNKKKQWNEVENRRRLILAGQRTNPDWFLTIDADERIEDRFWEDLPTILYEADKNRIIIYSFHLRELWDDPKLYRADGIWGKKTKAAFFRNLGKDHQFDQSSWHGEWTPMQAWQTDRHVFFDYDLYHLKMIDKVNRENRKNRYKLLDPNNEYQDMGYDYLTDEAGLILQSIRGNYKG